MAAGASLPDLTSKVVVITGGFGFLGQALAAAAAAAGARTVLIDHSPGPRAGGLSGDRALGGVDLADAEATASAFEIIGREFGRLDALLNIAGGFSWQTLKDGGLEPWSQLFRLNVLTAATASRAALPLLDGGGAIVNVAAAAATRAAAGMGAYAAAKSGVLRLTEALAEECKETAIRVNSVSPTIIDTPANRADMPKANRSDWVKAEDLAAVILFLASDAAAAVTGANILVSAGGRKGA